MKMDHCFRRSLHVFALFGFAVAQPLFDLLSRNADFLVAHDLRPLDLLLLAAIVCVVFPGLPVLVETLTGFLHRRAADYVHQLAAGLLIGAVALQAFKTLFAGPGLALVVAALLIGLPIGWASCRVRLVESFLAFLWPSIVVFPALFLLRPPVSDLLFVQREPPAVREGSYDIPVVLLVFDELPTSSLMDEHRRINAFRYPNFAALARDSHWFRNASTVSELTGRVLPALLTGRYTREPVPPIAANYPENLFTWLSGNYELNAFESVSRICPEELCRAPILRERFGERIRTTLSDLWLVYLHVVLPVDLSQNLPSVTATLRDFGATEPRKKGASPGELRRQRRDYGWVVSQFVDWIQPADGPVLYFLHTLVPHIPYTYLPSGKKYSLSDRPLAPHGLRRYNWGSDEWETVQAFQRHILQVGYADRLLGTLLRKLHEVGLYDRSLVIVVADHGSSFWPDGPYRVPEEKKKSWADILAVPLFVKVPHQRTAVVSDRNVEIIDVFPTIADVLGAELPWVVDGRSVLESSRSERSQKLFFTQENDRMERLVSDADLEGMAATVERKISLFGSGEDPHSIYRIGRFRSLVGQKIDQVPFAGTLALELELKEEWRFEEVDLDGPFIPAYIVGRINAGRGAAECLSLAVTVNGRIEAVTRTYKGPESPQSFTAMVPETVFKAGSNRVEVFVISGSEDCQGRSKFGPLRRSKSRPVGEGVAVFVGRLERSLWSPFRAAQA